MALETYASAADYQALYGADSLTGDALDNALWQASRDADRLTLGRIEAAGGSQRPVRRAGQTGGLPAGKLAGRGRRSLAAGTETL